MNEVLLTPKFTILSSSPSQAAVAQSPAQTQTPSRHFLPKPPTYKRFFLNCPPNVQTKPKRKTLPKAQRTRGLSSTYQSNFFGSYHKFKHKS